MCNSCSKTFLYIINSLVIIASMAMMAFAIWGLVDANSMPQAAGVFPQWVFWLTLFFGLAVIIVGALGCMGASSSNKCILALYILIVFVVAAVMIAAGVYALIYYNIIQGAADTEAWEAVNEEVENFENTLVTWFTSYPTEWKEGQDMAKCCGYDLQQSFKNDYDVATSSVKNPWVVSTGQYCYTDVSSVYSIWTAAFAALTISQDQTTYIKYTTDLQAAFSAQAGEAIPFCKDGLLAILEQYGLYIGIAAMVVGLIVLIAFFSACQLACCNSEEGAGQDHAMSKYA